MAETSNTKNDKPINQEEKRVYAALLVVAVAALGLGFWQLRNNIRLPFIINSNVNTNLAITTDESLLAMQNKDTDGDSLTDYDEVYVYGTSAFIADTDSDDYPDNEEIATGNNPLCPAKQTCLVAAPAFAAESLAPQTTSELRQVLIQAGVDPAQLANIDDATLLQLYSEVSAETTTVEAPATDGEAATGITLTDEQKQVIGQLSGSELREYLRQSGVDSEALTGIDDITLKLLVNEALGI